MFCVELCCLWSVKFTQIKDSERCRKLILFLLFLLVVFSGSAPAEKGKEAEHVDAAQRQTRQIDSAVCK